MKKSKNIILMAILVLSIFVFAGKVEAGKMSFTNQQIICEPNSLEAGESAKCYLVGKVEGQEPLTAFNGFVGVVYTSDDLVLTGVATDVPDATALLLDNGTSVTATDAPNNKYVTGESNTNVYQCALNWYNLSDTKLTATGASSAQAITNSTVNSQKCVVIFSNSGEEQKFTAANIKSADKHATALSDPVIKTYAVLGVFEVKLDDSTAKKPGSRCGDICVKVWSVPAATYYTKVRDCQALAGDQTNETCPSGGSDSVQQTCTEIHLKGDAGSTETGAFASYAILAAGAFIAISAVAIAKKNNKLYKI